MAGCWLFVANLVAQRPRDTLLGLAILLTGVPGAIPAGMTAQVPTLPARLHASQAAPQAVLQQTPSAQKPLLHWLPRPHAPPFVFCDAQAP